MERSRILLMLVVGLVLINIGLGYVCFFSNSKRPDDGGRSMHSWLDKGLGLTDEQEAQHVRLRSTYFDELKILNDSIRQIKARFIAHSANGDLSDSLATMWTDSINRWHRRADVLTFTHVRAVRNILEEKQKPLLSTLFPYW